MKKIVAHIGSDLFLVQTSENRAYLVDTRRKTRTDEKPIDIWAKMGYWEEYKGKITAEELEAKIN